MYDTDHCSVLSGLMIFVPARPMRGFASINDIASLKASGTISVSGLRKKTYFPLHCGNAWLLAAANPLFSVLAIRWADGKFSLMKSELLSDDALSTTNTSLVILLAAKTDLRQFPIRSAVL